MEPAASYTARVCPGARDMWPAASYGGQKPYSGMRNTASGCTRQPAGKHCIRYRASSLIRWPAARHMHQIWGQQPHTVTSGPTWASETRPVAMHVQQVWGQRPYMCTRKRPAAMYFCYLSRPAATCLIAVTRMALDNGCKLTTLLNPTRVAH